MEVITSGYMFWPNFLLRVSVVAYICIPWTISSNFFTDAHDSLILLHTSPGG